MFIKKTLLTAGFTVKVADKSEAIQLSKKLHRIGYKWQDGETLLNWFPPKDFFPVYYKIHVNILKITYSELSDYQFNWRGFYDFKEIWEESIIYKEV